MRFLLRLLLLLSIVFLNDLPAVAQPFPLNAKMLSEAKVAESKALQEKDSMQLAWAFYKYARTYTLAGDNHSGKRYYLRALRIAETRPESSLLGLLYVQICEYNHVKPESSEDINYLNKALAIFGRLGDNSGLAFATGMLQGAYAWRWFDGTLSKHPERIDSMLSLSRRQYQFAVASRDPSLIVNAHLRSGSVWAMLKRRDKSYAALHQGLSLARKVRNDTLIMNAYNYLSATHLGDGSLDSGKYYVDRAKQLYEARGFQQFFILLAIEGEYLNYYRLSGDWKKAYEQLGKLHTMVNLLDLSDYDKTTNFISQELAGQHSAQLLQAQHSELALKDRLVSSQRTFIIITILLLLVASVLSILFFRLYRKNQRTSNRNEQLVREQSHRVKNNLQLISSLLNMQAKQLSDSGARIAVEESQLRIQSMAIIQRRLYDSIDAYEIDLSSFLPEVAQGALGACGFGKIRLDFRVEPVMLNVDRTIPLGLILTELITNACKYAFPGHQDPILTIICHQEDDELFLTVSDNGTSPSVVQRLNDSTTPTESFGMQLIRLQTDQLYGHCKFSYHHGVQFRLVFPV